MNPQDARNMAADIKTLCRLAQAWTATVLTVIVGVVLAVYWMVA